MKTRFCTTAGMLTTLGTLGTGIGLSFHYASIIAKACLSKSLQLTNILESQFTIPGFEFNASIDIPTTNLSIPVPVLGKTFNITIPGRSLEFPVTTPSMSVELKDVVGQNIINAVNKIPSTLESICEIGSLQTGIAYTITATGLLGLLTYAYYKNATLSQRVEKLENENQNLIPLGSRLGSGNNC